MISSPILVLISSLISVVCCLSASDIEEDQKLTAVELIRKYGYPCEEYHVTTEDGYILTIFHIPHGRKTKRTKRTPVLLQHGLCGAASDWLLTGPENGFGYILADEGYDVYLPNSRGNRYSRSHETLNPDTDADYWKFSWHELGVYDLPAVVDFILNKTAQEQLFYVGHSQGTTSFFVMAAERPEYNAKIKAQFSYAPEIFTGNTFNPLYRVAAMFVNQLDMFRTMAGLNEFLPSDGLMAALNPVVCRDPTMAKMLCQNVFFMSFGFNPKEMNSTLIPLYVGHFPAGASTNQIIHYGQEVVSKRFRQFDYNSGNMMRYGQLYPPDYDLNKVTAPSYLFYSTGDWHSSDKDIDILIGRLPSSTVKGKYLVDDEQWNHVDYIVAISAKSKIYKPTLAEMKNLD